MEPAAGHEGPGGPGLDDAVKGCWMSPARSTYPLAKMDPSINEDYIPIRLASPVGRGLPLLLCYLAVSVMFLKILRGFNAAVQRQKKEKTGDASAFSRAGARPGWLWRRSNNQI